MMLVSVDEHRISRVKGACFDLTTIYAPQTKSLEGGTKGEIYPSQTKILEGGTKLLQKMQSGFRGTFQGREYTRFGLRTIEKSVENMDFISCSAFQNLRLGSIKSGFSMYLPM